MGTSVAAWAAATCQEWYCSAFLPTILTKSHTVQFLPLYGDEVLTLRGKSGSSNGFKDCVATDHMSKLLEMF
jgi:hypothetical protein